MHTTGRSDKNKQALFLLVEWPVIREVLRSFGVFPDGRMRACVKKKAEEPGGTFSELGSC